MPSPDADSLARVLRQREELGATEWIVEARTVGEMIEGARGLRREGAPRRAAADRSLRDEEVRASTAVLVPAERRPEAGDPAFEVGYDELRELAMGCTRCKLCEGRTQVVFSDGSPEGRLMVVGEAPGANEDRTGVPFVGAAGKLLDLLLATIDLSRKTSVYICNVIKCRPPGNRNPSPQEIASCAPFLRRQIEIVRPEAILAVGSFAARLLTGKDHSIGELRGAIHEYQGIPLVVTYHPAALLRNPGWTRPTWDDFQILSNLLDSRAENSAR
jgi:DNA polymerase